MLNRRHLLAGLSVALPLAACGPLRQDVLTQAEAWHPGARGFFVKAPFPAGVLPRARHPGVLAFSGGGADGAFGAGYLSGRIDKGAPSPDIVTGVSIGALIAPRAFIGDAEGLEGLLNGFTLLEIGRDIDPLRSLLAGSVLSGQGYEKFVARVLDDPVITRVGEAHAEGRRLFVATADFDSADLFVWNMGALARRNTPEARRLFRRIVLASGSIPGLFPPVALVDQTGQRRLFVDGGTAAYFYLPDLPRGHAPKRLEIVINNSLSADPALERITSIGAAKRGVNALIRAQALDLLELARRDAATAGARLTVASVPADFPARTLANLSPKMLRKLYAVGRDIAMRS